MLFLGLNRLLYFIDVKLLKGQLEDITLAVKSTEKNQEKTKENYEEQVKVHVWTMADSFFSMLVLSKQKQSK